MGQIEDGGDVRGEVQRMGVMSMVRGQSVPATESTSGRELWHEWLVKSEEGFSLEILADPHTFLS